MRRAARTDANQTEIVAGLRKTGCRVLPLHAVGHGVPDLLACRHGVLFFVEVKDGDKSPSRRQLTPDQEAWHRQWQDAPVYILTGVDGIPALLDQIAKDWSA